MRTRAVVGNARRWCRRCGRTAARCRARTGDPTSILAASCGGGIVRPDRRTPRPKRAKDVILNRDTAAGRGPRLPDQSAAAPALDRAINERYLGDESAVVRELVQRADAGEAVRERVRETAVELVARVRETERRHGGLDAFLHKYDLSSQEGVVLMCIAEALLRIPDADTADRLIADKLTSGRWEEHLGSSDSLFVNASTWGLMLTGRLMRLDEATIRNPAKFLGKLTGKAGEPVVRQAMRQAMKIMGHQFVMGRDIGEALERAGEGGNRAYRYSYDMLGEAALTAADAERYFRAYAGAIEAIGAAAGEDVIAAPGISVKLSALHPRYEFTHRGRLLDELVPRLARLTEVARDAGIPLTVDAEEADRLEISLEVFQAVAESTSAAGYDGLGLAVQAYQKRALPVIRWLAELAGRTARRIPVRLVKGAYWDTEIKRAQEQGLESYPVFTRKVNTDVSFLACARELLDAGGRLYPQFATHNAHTLASILHLAGERRDYEFQRLHGMARSPTIRGWTRSATTGRAGCTRRWAAMRICCPTWCAGCWRMARTPPSSTASSTRRRRWRRSLRTRWR